MNTHYFIEHMENRCLLAGWSISLSDLYDATAKVVCSASSMIDTQCKGNSVEEKAQECPVLVAVVTVTVTVTPSPAVRDNRVPYQLL